jgi:hypothetical protein
MRVRSLLAALLLAVTSTAYGAEKSVEETSGDWQILCFDDEVARYRSCYVIRDDLSVLISSRDYQLVFVGSGSDRQPGSEVSIQVDGETPIAWREDDFYADDAFASAINQFRAGKIASFTWTHKDTGQNVRGDVSLIGFSKAYRRANEIVAEYDDSP